MSDRPPDTGIYFCTGCHQSWTGPNAAADCKAHVRRCARLHGALFFAVLAFVATLFILHALGRLS